LELAKLADTLLHEMVHILQRGPYANAHATHSFIENLSIDDVNLAFADSWSPQHRLIEVAGNALIKPENSTPRLYGVYDFA